MYNINQLHKRWIRILHNALNFLLLKAVSFSMKYPVLVLTIVPVLSIGTFLGGFYTNFFLESDNVKLLTPTTSEALEFRDWIENRSGFAANKYGIDIFLHANGNNVVTRDGVDVMFRALEKFQKTTGYAENCPDPTLESNANLGNSDLCEVIGITNYFADEYLEFSSNILTDDELLSALNIGPFFPNGKPVNVKEVFGLLQTITDPQSGLELVSTAQALKLHIRLPTFNLNPVANKTTELDPSEDGGTANFSHDKAFEKLFIQNLLAYRQALLAEGNEFHIEIFSSGSLADESAAAVYKDLPLVPIMFVVICVFSCSVFFKRDKVQSSTLLLGAGSVITVILSLMTGCGILFCVGVPFSSLTITVPFVLLGIGLDDAYIISGTLHQTDHTRDIEERIKTTIEECGVSIVLTTLTTTTAFLLGLTSVVPALTGFYIYAAVGVIVDFVYQVTFFISLLYLDEKRKAGGRYDCLICLSNSSKVTTCASPNKAGLLVRVLGNFSETLLKSKVTRVLIILLFLAVSVFSAITASKIPIAFDFVELVSRTSYVKEYINTKELYDEPITYNAYAFFRFVDLSQPEVRSLARDYVDSIVALLQIASNPKQFWLNDFDSYIDILTSTNPEVAILTFEEQVELFLSDEYYNALYSKRLVRNSNGNLTATVTQIKLDNLGLKDAQNQVNFLKSQRLIGNQFLQNLGDLASQLPTEEGEETEPIEQEDFYEFTPFFTYGGDYSLWEFYEVVPSELISTTISAIAAVAVITIIFVPNLIAVAIVVPAVLMIYADVLAVMVLAGFALNPVTLISIIMSIGLMVDYVLHVVMKSFEESQDEKTEEVDHKHIVDLKECLTTMGSSVFTGGLSTILSTVPLAFSTSDIFFSIFVVFFSFVMISFLHGLVFVPAILAFLDNTKEKGKETRFDDKEVFLEDGNE